jgi:hypothetical protein
VISIWQAVRDDAASHESLIQLFERICNFLQRLERYIRNLFTDELTELLGKIMAQLLSILALSTKVMMDGRISGLNDLLYPSLADSYPENAVRRLAGRRDIEDAVSRLDTLTKDENLVVVAKSLECTQHFLSIYIHVPTFLPSCAKQCCMRLKVCFFLTPIIGYES